MLVGGSQGHGAFTYSILRGLQGAAADKGVVWISDLFSQGSKEVPRLTTGKQHPHSQITGTKLPLFVVDEKVHQVITQETVVPITPVPGLALAPPKREGEERAVVTAGCRGHGGHRGGGCYAIQSGSEEADYRPYFHRCVGAVKIAR